MNRNNVLVLAAILLLFCLLSGCGDDLVSSPGNVSDGGGTNCAWREKTWSCNDNIQKLSSQSIAGKSIAGDGGLANEKK